VLTLTDAAVAAIRDLLAQTALPAWGGLRISAAAPATGGDEPGFEITVVVSGEATDAVAEREGAYVYLEPTAVSVFDDKVLDARLGAAGVSLKFQPSPLSGARWCVREREHEFRRPSHVTPGYAGIQRGMNSL
jgi:Fe-S cluster assembly iron-binding protein IscA